ncbi:hypothetical protein [Pectobacterium sp. PL64]|uniref:hypothetical protein n=1 Tax=Pectobacterium sp. PL64 TaxID=2738983 RepID=UPI00352CEC28
MIFNGEMVRAILDGRKTQTRRVMKVDHEHGMKNPVVRGRNGEVSYVGCRLAATLCPYGEVGDRLWVRETFAALEPGSYEQVKPRQGYCQDLRYAATDCLAKSDANIRGYKWVPSIHMPRWASRILLEITDVRVERLKHIPRDGIIAEGYPAERATDGGEYDPFLWYRDLWESIYGAGSWQANPWIWVIEFKQIK